MDRVTRWRGGGTEVAVRATGVMAAAAGRAAPPSPAARTSARLTAGGSSSYVVRPRRSPRGGRSQTSAMARRRGRPRSPSSWMALAVTVSPACWQRRAWKAQAYEPFCSFDEDRSCGVHRAFRGLARLLASIPMSSSLRGRQAPAPGRAQPVRCTGVRACATELSDIGGRQSRHRRVISALCSARSG
jgi:hypothetical protein